MRIIPVQYECEVCNRRYDTLIRAAEHERMAPPVYPVGMIFGDHTKGTIYSSITFAIAKVCVEEEEHANRSPLWACRQNGCGDSLEDHTCSMGFISLGRSDARLNLRHPSFLRMVKYLRSKNIPVTVWNGKEEVPYAD